jgi:hypothetical protein
MLFWRSQPLCRPPESRKFRRGIWGEEESIHDSSSGLKDSEKTCVGKPEMARTSAFFGSVKPKAFCQKRLKLSFGFAELVTLRVPRFRRPFSLVRFFLDEQKEMNI